MHCRGPSILRAFYAGIEIHELRVSLFILTALGLFLTLLAARIDDSFGALPRARMRRFVQQITNYRRK